MIQRIFLDSCFRRFFCEGRGGGCYIREALYGSGLDGVGLGDENIWGRFWLYITLAGWRGLNRGFYSV